MRPYIVRQGDYLTRIASQVGADEEEIWSAATNQDLARSGRTPDVLAPGDIVNVPDGGRPAITLALHLDNRYAGVVPEVPVTLVFQGRERVCAGAAFDVRGVTTHATGRVTSDGSATFHVSVVDHEVELRIPSLHRVYYVRVGDVDPLEERSGMLRRLEQLGHPAVETGDGETGDDALSSAIASFQRAEGLPLSGALDEATRSRIKARFGC